MGGICRRSRLDSERGFDTNAAPTSPPDGQGQPGTVSKRPAKVAKSDLRFEVGTRVECNCGCHWASGTIVAQWWRDDSWPPGKVVPYQIKVDKGGTIFVPTDSDRHVKRVEGLLAHGQIRVTILTGFLGAGKTTLLNYILTAQHGKKYAVVENEFGAVPIDNQLLDQAVGKLDTVESVTVLDNGCLCCTVRDDLERAMGDIIKNLTRRYDSGVKDAILDGILIETTGMADPGPIINTFSKNEQLAEYCKIDGILTVVDCKHFLKQLHRERQGGSVNESAQQVAFADKLLLNKIDACTRELIDETKGAIRGINEIVPIRECSLAKNPAEVPIDQLLAIDAFDGAKMITDQATSKQVDLANAHVSDGDDGNDANCMPCSPLPWTQRLPSTRHDTDVSSMVLEKAFEGIDLQKFHEFVGTLITERPEDLYRYKGVLHALHAGKSHLYILQGVHDMPELVCSGAWPTGKPIKTQIVLIGRKLERARYQKMFDACIDWTGKGIPLSRGRQ